MDHAEAALSAIHEGLDREADAQALREALVNEEIDTWVIEGAYTKDQAEELKRAYHLDSRLPEWAGSIALS